MCPRQYIQFYVFCQRAILIRKLEKGDQDRPDPLKTLLRS